MGEVGFIGEGGDKLIAAFGEGCGGVRVGFGKGGEDEEPVVGERLPPFGWDDLGERAGGTNDDGLFAAKKNAEAFAFNGRMKTADDAASGVTPFHRLIVGRENHAARIFPGTEERCLGEREQLDVADGEECRCGAVA